MLHSLCSDIRLLRCGCSSVDDVMNATTAILVEMLRWRQNKSAKFSSRIASSYNKLHPFIDKIVTTCKFGSFNLSIFAANRRKDAGILTMKILYNQLVQLVKNENI